MKKIVERKKEMDDEGILCMRMSENVLKEDWEDPAYDCWDTLLLGKEK